MTPHLVYGRCGGDSHTPGEATTNQETDHNEQSERHYEDGDKRKSDQRNEREGPEMNAHLVTPSKWSDSQARRTSDAQSEVFDTGTKKPGGGNDMKQQRKSGQEILRMHEQKRKKMRKDLAESRARLRTDRIANSGGWGSRRVHSSVRKARKEFMKANTPASEEVVKKIKQVHVKKKRKHRRDPTVKAGIKEQRRARKEAIRIVNELLRELRDDKRGKVSCEKPDDVLRLIFENVNSLGVFSTGRAKL